MGRWAWKHINHDEQEYDAWGSEIPKAKKTNHEQEYDGWATEKPKSKNRKPTQGIIRLIIIPLNRYKFNDLHIIDKKSKPRDPEKSKSIKKHTENEQQEEDKKGLNEDEVWLLRIKFEWNLSMRHILWVFLAKLDDFLNPYFNLFLVQTQRSYSLNLGCCDDSNYVYLGILWR